MILKEHLYPIWSQSVELLGTRGLKCPSQIEARAAILDVGSARKITTLGRDLIRNICTKLEVNRCSHSWEEVKNVSANQRPRRPFWIFRSARKIRTLVRDLLRNICTKLEVNRYSGYWEEVENVLANQRAGYHPIRGNGGHLGFSDRHEK